jgi:hypothetical protein
MKGFINIYPSTHEMGIVGPPADEMAFSYDACACSDKLSGIETIIPEMTTRLTRPTEKESQQQKEA